MQKEFDSILTSRNVVNKLNELEGLVSEAELRRDEAGLPDQNNIPTPYVYQASIAVTPLSGGLLGYPISAYFLIPPKILNEILTLRAGPISYLRQLS